MPGKDGMGLLPRGPEGRIPDDYDGVPPGKTGPPPGVSPGDPRRPTPPDSTGEDEARYWKEPCHFSCVPYRWIPVDVYNPDGTDFVVAPV